MMNATRFQRICMSMRTQEKALARRTGVGYLGLAEPWVDIT
jgi:hypothetical protein